MASRSEEQVSATTTTISTATAAAATATTTGLANEGSIESTGAPAAPSTSGTQQPQKRKNPDDVQGKEKTASSAVERSAAAEGSGLPQKKMTKLSRAAAHAARAFEFYKSIGSPRHIVAPMVDQSEHAFRRLTRRYGADLCYTPMFNSSKMVHDKRYMGETLQDLSGYTSGDRPLFVQICGHKPDEMLVAAKAIEHMADAVDINLGCPQLIAKRGRYGAFLLEEFDLLERIVSTLSQNLNVPLTCKIRILPDFNRTLQLAKLLERSGCSLLTVHGRTKEEKGPKLRNANWDWIRRIKEELSIPVVANGSIGRFEDIQACIDATGVDGVMSSEAVLEDPMLFSGPPDPHMSDLEHFQRKVNLVREYLDLVVQYPPRCDKVVKKHVMALMFGGFIHNKRMIQEVFKPRDVKGIRAAVESVLKCVLEAEAAKQQGAAPALDPITALADDQSTEEEQERQIKFDRYAMLPNGEGRWYWRYRLRPDSMKRKTFEHSPAEHADAAEKGSKSAASSEADQKAGTQPQQKAE